MDAVYNYILEYYKAGEPIFLSDIKMSEVSDETIRQQLKPTCRCRKTDAL